MKLYTAHLAGRLDDRHVRRMHVLRAVDATDARDAVSRSGVVRRVRVLSVRPWRAEDGGGHGWLDEGLTDA